MLPKNRWTPRLVARWRRLAVLGLVAVTGPALIGLTPVAAAADPKRPDFPEPQKIERVELGKSKVQRREIPKKTYAKFDASKNAALPAAQDTTVKLTGRSKVRAGSSPISIGSATATQVRVTTADQKAAQKAGVHGLMFTLSGSAAGRVDVSVDPSTFRNAYGGGYASRLRLVHLPDCALTTPELERCRTQTPLPTGIGSPLSAPATVSSRTLVLAATAAASGGGGDFSATDLSPAGSWSTSGNTGSFTYSYPIAIPPAVGGDAPALNMTYNSGSQDARTLATNNQSSWVGDGWSLGDNYIERTYRSCDDVEDSGAPEHSGDSCWSGQVLTMSLNGTSTSIVYDDKTKTFRSERDASTTKVENLSNTVNGTKNNEYFRVAENGVQYYFGLNRLPGWASGEEETKSVRTVPVYKAHAGVGDCPDGSFAATSCKLGYRFNLDYVVDRNGNARAYYYDQELGYYGANMKDTAVEYVRGGTLKRIDYGMRPATIYSAKPAAQVLFTVDERCFKGEPAGNNCESDQFGVAHPEYWPDVPVDLNCVSGATDCTNHGPSFWSRKRLTKITTQALVSGVMKQVDRYDLTQSFPTGGDHAPTLWLGSVKHTGLDRLGGATADADGGTVTFYPRQLRNRVGTLPGLEFMHYNRVGTVVSESGAETIVTYSTPNCAGVPASDLNDDKDTAAQAYASTNKTGCFPVYWAPEGQPRPLIDWFYTHPVTSIVTIDNYNHYQDGSQPKTITEYAYKGDPGWHYDDNEVVKKENRTWGQFRGYPEVHVTTGDTSVFHYTDKAQVFDQKTLTKTFYFLGMNGDTLPSGQPRSVPPLTSTDGTVTVADSPELAGEVFETVNYTGVNGTIDSATVSVPKIIGPTASRARQGLPALEAYMLGTARTLTRQKVSYGWRRTETATFYNTTLGQSTTGMPVQSVDRGEAGAAGNVTKCTFTRYIDGAVTLPGGGTAPLVLPAEVITTTQDCTAANATPSGTLISDKRTSYDGKSFAYNGDGQTNPARPAIGNATLVQTASAATGVNVTSWLDATATTYDSYGRTTSVTRTPKSAGLSQTVYTRVSPASGALPSTITTVTQVASGVDCSAVTVSSKDCRLSSNSVNPPRQVALAETDIAGALTSLEYDALGRLTGVWLPNQNKAAGAPANMTYQYATRATAPSVVTTSTLNDSDAAGATPTYTVAKVLYDAMLRPLESQSTGENGSVVVNDTQYDSHGWTVLTNNAYAVTGSPRDTLISDHLSQVSIPSTTVTDHDAMGRTTQTTAEHNGVATWHTRSVNTGDKVTTVPPTGGVATTSVTNARGQMTELQQYTTAPTLSGSITAGFTATGGTANSTTYSYTAAGQQATVTGPDKAVWTYTYDLLGRQTRSADPDTGMSLASYDDAGNQTATKDARGIELNHTYDLLGRKLATTDKSKSGFRIASWSYDTLRIGLPTSSTRYVPDVIGGYTVAVTGYSTLGKPLGQTVTLPSSEAPLPVSYTTEFAYTDNNEFLAQQTDPAAGGLPQETISYSRNVLGAPTKTTGINAYVSSTVYTDFGQPSRVTLGSSAHEAQVLYTYDDSTLRRTSRSVYRTEGIGPLVDETNYTYDDAGNPLSVVNKQSENGNVVTDAQCFRYDSLARLTEAWTAPSACPAATTVKPTADGVAGGTGSYWQSFTYDAVGSRTKLVDRSAATGGTTTSYVNGCSTGCNRTGAQPHTLTATKDNADPTTFVYDVAGNLLSRTATSGRNQTLKWDDEGRLAEVTTGSGTTKYLYDADGNQLIRRDPGRTSFFAADTEVVINTAADPVVSLGAVRTYTQGGGGAAVAVRSTLPGGGTHYLISDGHDSATLSMDVTTQEVSRQQFKPYGEDRRSENATAWPDMTRGYLGAARNTDTGYTDTGARKYDPALGRFISPDPLLVLTDPSQLGGYTYAGANPVTNSDPSGLRIDPNETGCAAGNGGACNGYVAPPGGGKAEEEDQAETKSNNDGTGSVGGVTVTTNQVNDLWTFGMEANKAYYSYYNAWGKTWVKMPDDLKLLYMMTAACQVEGVCRGSFPGELKNQLNMATFYNAGCQGKCLENRMNTAELIGGTFMDGMGGLNAMMQQRVRTSKAGIKTASIEGMGLGTSFGCLRNSFAPDTRVLMADGSTKPISEVGIGDEVLATDPATGRTAPREVTALHLNIDTELTDLTLNLPDGTTSVVHTTAEHPFWAEERAAWVHAGNLQPGERMSALGASTDPTVAAVRVFPGRQPMYNITVDGIHTFYVVAANTPVLVHNCATANPHDLRRTEALSGAYDKQRVEEITESMKENGWVGAPIDVFEQNGNLYILNGHHRTAAAKRAGINVKYRLVPESELGEHNYRDAHEVVSAAVEVGADRIDDRRRRGRR
ncbi:polymorphic toxin-type HINT domain-containing protein [Actinoplanes sp. CA-131856]